ncbi:hypothetical protein SERLA73DRAFT_167589 [Serpula lacrymans var. lacrymans S7.3]|uniref:E3 ubiquitin protein ligase n=2 Tax=Serpula lacrymans var. lacrymans TaxID=341189 RepID=F8PUG3_SERL3|nr:uncharacterized protein SERLADRAFT_448242 [Serpula lacrymans var. lacrymans S7.9]EGN99683.1 hypothetical protein SERLA73DRAFT_167589 [Serpula lacrymans var. lacrymans S7.3]EGO25243.1 hypothetical protein SERLADRAFT_448242 [Serpula lacrymans var. lacrymans S7.9]
MDSKKRPFTDDGETQQHKKRILTGVNGSPLVNGTDLSVEEPTDTDNLELFRKEAIYRRMKHYSREHERSQLRIVELEQRKSTCEAGLVAIAACWEQLVDTIQTLAQPEQLPKVEVETADLFDLTRHVSGEYGLQAALEKNMHATQKLVTSFLQLGGDSRSATIQNEAYQRCQKSQTECSALRSEIELIRARLRDLESEKEKYHEDLVRSEIRVDRLRSSNTVQAMQSQAPVEKLPVKDEETSDVKVKQASPPHPPINGHDQHPPDFEELKDAVKVKDSRVTELEQENARLLSEIHSLKLEVKSPSEESIAETPYFKILLDHASRLENAIAESAVEFGKVSDSLSQLQASRKDFEEEARAAAGLANQELKTMLAKRDSDNVRLRDQREQHAAEISERKHKDSVKMTSYQELKTLSESRLERIRVLESEVKRLKAQLAVGTGNEDLLAFFFGDKVDDTSYIDDMQSKLQNAEAKVAALEKSLSSLQEDHPDIVQHVKNETELRQELAGVMKQLEQYRSIFGHSAPPEVRNLSEQLQQKEEEIRRLKLSETQQKQAETSLYAEIDRLSSAWEGLDLQLSSKVSDLGALEERLSKAITEKAKSDNKYYTAMRAKEAIDSERKNIARNLEKQAKLIDRALESEKNLNAQVGDLEKEIVTFRKAGKTFTTQIAALEKDVTEWKYRAESERKRCAEARAFALQKEQGYQGKQSEVKKLDEEMHRMRKEFDRQATKLKSMSAGPSSHKEAELQAEIEKLMSVLKCSTCKERFRSTVITKCMHTFCKECVDARISTRQRKCPTCNLSFAQSEAQQVYFQ